MKRVQLAGSTFDVEGFLVGLDRELRVDISNDSLRLHDGVKVGGFEFLNRDAMNVLYQARSPELDGFSFGAQEKGILTRVGPATYRVRRIEVNTDNMVITNPRGTEGNYHLTLNPTIASDHLVTGLWTFEQPIAADGGVVGNVIGDLTSDTFGTHTGPVTGDTTGTHYGSLNTTGGTIVMEDDQLPENAVHQLLINRGVPYGCIMLWSGIVSAIPESWALCDGTNGTPDLRDRFVVGAGGEYGELESGGEGGATLTGTIGMGGAHIHNVEVGEHTLTETEIPSHKHGNGVADAGGLWFNHGSFAASPTTSENPQNNHDNPGTIEGWTANTGGGDSHTHEDSQTSNDGAHSHDITLDDVSFLPPYFALCYIMKIAAD